jgi:hypothetical protein
MMDADQAVRRGLPILGGMQSSRTRLSEGMDTLLGSSSEARQRVEVVHLHAYVHNHVSRLKQLATADDRTIDDSIGRARRGLDLASARLAWLIIVSIWAVSQGNASVI